MDIRLQISSELERISYVLNFQSSNYLCELITAMWEWLPKYSSVLPVSVSKLSRACHAGQEILMERDGIFSGSSLGNGEKVDQPLVALVLPLMHYTDSQKIQLTKIHAKNKSKNWKRQKGPEDWENVVKKSGKKVMYM